MDEVEHLAVYILKMTMFDYSVLHDYSQLVVVAAALLLTAKLHQHHHDINFDVGALVIKG